MGTSNPIPRSPWQPHRFTVQEHSIALQEALERVHGFISSMLKQTTLELETQGRDELTSLRNELDHLDEELHHSDFYIEILNRLLLKAQRRRTLLASNRINKYNECQALATKNATHNKTHLPPEIVSRICSSAISSPVSPGELPAYFPTWGNLLSYSVSIRVDDHYLVQVLSDPALSEFRKELEISGKAPKNSMGFAPPVDYGEEHINLIRDAHQRGKIKFLHYRVTFNSGGVFWGGDKSPRIQKDLLLVCNELTITNFGDDPVPPTETLPCWNEDDAPTLRTFHGSSDYLHKLCNLLRNVTSLELTLRKGDNLDRCFRGLPMPCLKKLVILGGKDWLCHEHHDVVRFPLVSDLTITICGAIHALSILKALKCDSLQSLELHIIPIYQQDSVIRLLEFVCANVDTLSRLTFCFGIGIVFGVQVTSAEASTIRSLLQTLLPREQGEVPLPKLDVLEIPYREDISEPLIELLAARAMSRPVRKLVLVDVPQSSDSPFDRMGLYVTDLFLEHRKIYPQEDLGD